MERISEVRKKKIICFVLSIFTILFSSLPLKPNYLQKIEIVFRNNASKSVFAVCQYCEGGMLSVALRLKGCETHVFRSYVAQLVCSLELVFSLHRKHGKEVPFRSNYLKKHVLLSANGTLVLNYLIMDDSREKVSSQSFESRCAFFLGVLLLELFCAKRLKFDAQTLKISGSKNENAKSIPKDLWSLIESLIYSSEREREEFVKTWKNMPFFKGIDWNKIEHCSIETRDLISMKKTLTIQTESAANNNNNNNNNNATIDMRNVNVNTYIAPLAHPEYQGDTLN